MIFLILLLAGCATQQPVTYKPPQFIQTVPTAPKRTLPQVVTVWFGSYVDRVGNFHNSERVYTVVQPSEWSNASLQVRRSLPVLAAASTARPSIIHLKPSSVKTIVMKKLMSTSALSNVPSVPSLIADTKMKSNLKKILMFQCF